MLFNSHLFLIVFLPIILFVFYSVSPSWRVPSLLISSLLFYGYSGLDALMFMLIVIAWGYLTAFAFSRTGKRILLIWLSISVPILILFVFKYLYFTFETLGIDEGPVRELFYGVFAIVLPAGISFYTFQIMAYSLDVSSGRIKAEKNLLRLATYISFFPQLIAGPIVRYEKIQPQLLRLAKCRNLNPDIFGGIRLVVMGLAAKVFFADILKYFHKKSSSVDWTTSGTTPDALFSIFSYSFIIYYDFWAYSIIAIGLGKLFSINLPRNFNEPYLAATPSEFWRRWHMTLSNWLRDYVYIKLGGTKKYVRNILIVFATVGLWHGAGWNFVAWGLYHAALIIIYHFTKPVWKLLPTPVQIALTYTLVCLGWPLFYLEAAGYWVLLQKTFGFLETGIQLHSVIQWIVLLAIGTFTFAIREERWVYAPTQNNIVNRPALQSATLVLGILFLSLSDTFIYFRF